MIKASHLKQLIIKPTLEYLGMNSPAAVNLLLGTAAQESHLGFYLMQVNSEGDPLGPALGIYQMEPDTHDDIRENFLEYRDDLEDQVNDLCGPSVQYLDSLVSNIQYATAIARIHYYRVPEALPEADDVDGLAKYWKRFYNTYLGKGTTEEFKINYEKFGIGEL